MDSDEDYEMNSSGEDFNHSHHFTEEDLLDSLFLTCDVKKAGVVPVSNLIEYLKFTSSAISERDDDLQNLEHLFNEGGDEVNIETYRQVMYHWIDAIRKRSENESSQEDGLERRSNGPLCLSKDISILRGLNMDSSIVDTFGTDFDPVDQQNTIEDLQHQNRKLTEENTKLRQQIDVQDDIVTTNQNEIDKLHKKVKSLQQTADSKHETIAENEELKSTISKLQEKKKDLSTKITQIDKENLSYENQCSDLQLKLIELTSQLESLTSAKELLNKEAAEYKHELVHARDLKSLQEIQLNERYLEVNSLKKQLEDLCVQLKDYKKENDEVKFELMQSKQDITSFSHMPSESGDGVEEMISKAAGSFVCSTPMRHSQSLCMELKGMLGSDKHLPSPLCPKEYHKEYRMDLLPVFDEEDEDCNPEDDTDNQLAADISSFTEKFKHKQSELLAEIDSYFRQDNEENQTSKESLHSSLQKELTEMTEQMASLAIAKDTVDKRVNHLSKSMKKIRDENAMLRRVQHDSRSMLVECDRDLQNVVDRRLLILKDNLDEEKNLVKRLKKELEEKSKTILKLESLQTLDKTEKHKEEINVLKRTNMELFDKCAKSEGQINCLQDDMRKSEKDVEIEKLRSYELEENLYSNKLSRQMDLKEIWRIVQKDIENECQDEISFENEMNDSADTIKRRIFNEILALKSDLHLTKSTFELKSKKKESSLRKCSCFGTGSSASSPLVEALTIDFFNGNRPLPQILTDSPSLNKEQSSRENLNDMNDCSSVSTENTVVRNRLLSQNSSTDGILEFDCRSESDTNIDINENEDSFVSLEDSMTSSLRRLSYQAAIDDSKESDKTDVVIGSTDSESAIDLIESQSNCDVAAQPQRRLSSGCTLMGDDVYLGDNIDTSSKGVEDYCWKDNMVVFDEDVSYSSYSFSHLSYPFQPLRQDVFRDEDSHNEEEPSLKQSVDSISYSKEEEEVKVPDSVIREPDLCIENQDSSSNDSGLSLTSALTNKLEKLTLEEPVEKEECEVDGLSPIEGMKMEHTDMKVTSSQLSQIRQNNLARRREQMKHIAVMPDLKESRESMMSGEDILQSEEPKPPEEKEDEEPPAEVEKAVLPSVPDTFLKKLGLKFKKNENIANSIHQLTESEIENKFTSLSLAFKTDKLTLEKRLEIQERYRDLSEQNVDKEIKGLRTSLETISQLPECVDSQVQDVLKKIRRHIDVLEQTSTKVSSRAEVFGAVQQEKRMSKAIEVMIAHVENLKMAYEQEHKELEEARKLIQDGRPFGHTFDSDSSGFASRRSASVCQGIGVTKTARRRVSESTGPRVGSNGTLSHSMSLDLIDTRLGLRKDPRDDEDAKSKFQNVIASTVMKNSVTSSLRTNSTDRLSLSSREPSTEGERSLTVTKQNSKEEEAFQKGFEQGYKALVGRDLANLREQQNNVSNTLENIMDEVEQDTEQEEKNLSETIKEKFWENVPSWDVASKKLRMTMAGFVFFMALCSIVLSFFPYGQAAMQVQPQYKHMGQPPS
ncbi:inositol 1,4,5-triphosphate receptor associated 2-like isoform X2 [Mytilus trossulus]|uniref:inositol 1,4,5-triphosphate receptor associated 2-like isoform X2 n=1 Tax=Mytilus trossulus TaxID=6551 RepID=UPI00300540B3